MLQVNLAAPAAMRCCGCAATARRCAPPSTPACTARSRRAGQARGTSARGAAPRLRHGAAVGGRGRHRHRLLLRVLDPHRLAGRFGRADDGGGVLLLLRDPGRPGAGHQDLLQLHGGVDSDLGLLHAGGDAGGAQLRDAGRWCWRPASWRWACWSRGPPPAGARWRCCSAWPACSACRTPARMDLVSFINSMLAQLAGIGAAAVFTRLLRSVSADWTARRLLRAGWRELAQPGQQPPSAVGRDGVGAHGRPHRHADAAPGDGAAGGAAGRLGPGRAACIRRPAHRPEHCRSCGSSRRSWAGSRPACPA